MADHFRLEREMLWVRVPPLLLMKNQTNKFRIMGPCSHGIRFQILNKRGAFWSGFNWRGMPEDLWEDRSGLL